MNSRWVCAATSSQRRLRPRNNIFCCVACEHAAQNRQRNRSKQQCEQQPANQKFADFIREDADHHEEKSSKLRRANLSLQKNQKFLYSAEHSAAGRFRKSKRKRREEEFRPAQPWIPANLTLSRRHPHFMTRQVTALSRTGHFRKKIFLAANKPGAKKIGERLRALRFSLRTAALWPASRPVLTVKCTRRYRFTGGLAVVGFLRRTGGFFSPPFGLISAK